MFHVAADTVRAGRLRAAAGGPLSVAAVRMTGSSAETTADRPEGAAVGMSGEYARPTASPRTGSAPPPTPSPPRRPPGWPRASPPADLAAAEIYPTIVWERGEPLDEVTAHYEALVTYFRAAAREGDGVLLRIGW